MAKADFSYIGKGRVFLGPYGGGGAAIEVGNVSKLEFSVDEEKKDLLDYTSAGGGKRNSLSRISAVNVNMTLHDLDSDNLARAVFGSSSAVTAGAVTGEAHTAYIGGLVRFNNVPNATIAPVVTGSGGTPTYTAGTDYEVVGGGVVILEGGAITDALAIEVGYTKVAGNVVEALTSTSQEYTLTFVGLNEAQSGKAVVVDVHRAKFSPLSNLALIGDDFAALDLNGESLSDSTVVGAGLSKFFKVEVQS